MKAMAAEKKKNHQLAQYLSIQFKRVYCVNEKKNYIHNNKPCKQSFQEVCFREKEREYMRERMRETDRGRETERQRENEGDRRRETERQREDEGDRERMRETDRERETER